MTLRPLWKLHRFVAALLLRRLKALRTSRFGVRLLALWAPAVTAIVVWAAGALSPDLISSLLILLAAQMSGVLRHPVQVRRSVRHPLTRRYFWAIQVICALGLVSLLMVVSLGGREEPLLVQGWRTVHDVTLVLALLSLVSTALPVALWYAASLVRRLGMVLHARGILLPASRLYLLVMGGFFFWAWTTVFLRGLSDPREESLGARTLLSLILLALLLPPFVWWRLPWRRTKARVLAILPQGFGWTAFLFCLHLTDGWDSLPLLSPASDRTLRLVLILLLSLLFLTAVVYLFRERLRYSVVDGPPESIGDEAMLSVQPDPSQYVDTSGHAARLLRFIGRSDGGVIGLTGVRGVGKSALILRVLSELRRRHMTLAMTAPVRHEPGMGFLIMMCRAVCRQVLDDVHQGLYGRVGEPQRARGEILRRIRNIGLIASLITIFIMVLIGTGAFSKTGLSKLWEIGAFDSRTRQHELCLARLDRQLMETRDVLGQIEDARRLISQRPAPEQPRFLLIPNCKGKFNLLQAGQTSATEQMARLKKDLRQTCAGFRNVEAAHSKSGLGIPRWQPDCSAYFDTASLTHYERTLEMEFLGSAQDNPGIMIDSLLRAFLASSERLVFDTVRLNRLHALLLGYKHLLEEPLGLRKGSVGAGMSNALLFGKVLLVVVLLIVLVEAAWRAIPSLARAMVNWRYVALAREAEEFLETLSYSESRETSGGLSWKGLSLQRSRSLTARDLTLPGLTARYIDFVRSVTGFYNGKLIIAIDELDKIHDSESVKALLAEIKGALFAKGCYYLISISEDATRAFRQRLSAGRDIFESTFDEIVEIQQMKVEAASEMIKLRLAKTPPEHCLPRSCWYILALFGGGIPREIVRQLRSISMMNIEIDRLSPREAAAHLLCSELKVWMARLGEVELSGRETITLRSHAKEALEALRATELGNASWDRVRDRLEESLAILDPDRLRATVTSIPLEKAQEPKPEDVRYRALADDIQACLRLLILVTIGQLTCSGEDAWKAYEERILEAYATLAVKPALAEEMHQGIRTALLSRPPAVH